MYSKFYKIQSKKYYYFIFISHSFYSSGDLYENFLLRKSDNKAQSTNIYIFWLCPFLNLILLKNPNFAYWLKCETSLALYRYGDHHQFTSIPNNLFFIFGHFKAVFAIF